MMNLFKKALPLLLIGFNFCFAQDCYVFDSEQTVNTIRCAVHIYYHDTLENSFVSEENVVDAIEYLNLDLNQSNIQVQLIDILYVDLDGKDGYLNNAYCFPSAWTTLNQWGILQAYAPEMFLNIYVMPKFCSSILGFAFLSGGMPADGVYVRTDCFGYQLPYNYPTRDLNKTLTHEVGHYFGLHHTFRHVDFCGQNLGDCCETGDYVCDTPPTKLNWSCENPICPTGLYDYSANNYMDYYVDSCKAAFTDGQIERMDFWLDTVRSSLLPTDGCDADIDGDGIVGTNDLLIMLQQWNMECDGI
jgi:hypothetical protein